MLKVSGGLYTVATIIELAIIIISFLWLFRRSLPELTRRNVVWIGVFWTLFVTVEYWMLGPRSFVHINDEGELSLPIILYLTRWYQGGTFVHGLGGGSDAKAMFSTGAEYISLELWLFKLFPLWIALALHKIMVVAAAFCGSYLLARRAGGAERWLAVAIATLITVAHRYSLSGTLTHGLGYALVPLAVYLFVFRIDKPRYLLEVTVFSMLHAISFTPAASIWALGPAIVFVWIAEGARRAGRFLLAVFFLGAWGLANWHEAIYGMAQTSAFSFRILGFGSEIEPINAIGRAFRYLGGVSPEHGILVVLCLAVIAYWNRKVFRSAVIMTGLSMTVGPLLLAVPWASTPFGFLAAFDFGYIAFSATAIVVLLAARAGGVSYGAETVPRRVRQLVFCGVAAIALGQVGWQKTFNFAQWLGMGGQRIYAGYPNLQNRPWAPKELFRVATVPYLLDPNTTASYGLESFGSNLNIFPYRKGLFFFEGLPRSNRGVVSGYNYITSHRMMNFTCCNEYAVDGVIDLNRLRMANVTHLISVLPLKGEGIRLVSGPEDGYIPPRSEDPLPKKLLGFLSLLFEKKNAYVYEILNSLPRAYIASNVSMLPKSLSGTPYYDFVNRRSLEREAVLEGDNAKTVYMENPAKGKIISVEEIPDGYRLRTKMDGEGVVVLNTPWMPFWMAYQSGKPLPVSAANAIHLAVRVPAGDGVLDLFYRPPTLKGKIAERFDFN